MRHWGEMSFNMVIWLIFIIDNPLSACWECPLWVRSLIWFSVPLWWLHCSNIVSGPCFNEIQSWFQLTWKMASKLKLPIDLVYKGVRFQLVRMLPQHVPEVETIVQQNIEAGHSMLSGNLKLCSFPDHLLMKCVDCVLGTKLVLDIRFRYSW